MTSRTLIILIIICLTSHFSNATTYTVNSTGDVGGAGLELREAIIMAINDNTDSPMNPHIIDFDLAPNSTITLTMGNINISNVHLRIEGTGIEDLMIDGGMNGRIFEIQGTTTVTILDLTLQNGLTGSSGGALTVETNSELTLERVRFRNNQGENGGAIRAGNNSILTASFCIFESNRATANGGAINAGDDQAQITLINNSIFRGNEAYNEEMTIGRGGAILINRGILEINNSVISGNVSYRSGSGISILGGIQTNASIINCTVSGNVSGTGGAINNNGELRIGNTIVALNLSYDPNADMDNDPSASLGGNLIGDNTGAETAFPPGTPNGNGDYIGTKDLPVNPFFLENVPNSLMSGASTGGNLNISMLSPGVNHGVNENAPPMLPDVKGNLRIQNGTVDIGAYESPFADPVPTLSQWALMILGLSLLITGVVAVRRLRRQVEGV